MWDPAEHLVSLAENQNLKNINYMSTISNNRHNCVIIDDFLEILIFGIKASSETSRKYFNNLRFVCNRAHVRSRRAPREFGRNQNLENTNYTVIFVENRLQMCHNSRFSKDSDFCIRASSEISRKVFQSLRFVCNHSHVGSCRALCDFGRTSKIRKIQLYAHICQKSTINMP